MDVSKRVKISLQKSLKILDMQMFQENLEASWNNMNETLHQHGVYADVGQAAEQTTHPQNIEDQKLVPNALEVNCGCLTCHLQSDATDAIVPHGLRKLHPHSSKILNPSQGFPSR